MFWKKIAKIVLYVNVGFGFIVSIAAGKAVGKMMDYVFDSGSGTGFWIFLLGIVITLVNSCILGTICEIGDNVEKIVKTSVSGNVPVTAKPVVQSPPVTPRVQVASAAPKESANPAAPVAPKESSEPVVPAKPREPKVYDNRVLNEKPADTSTDLDKEINMDDNYNVDLDATVALPESAFEEMGLVVEKAEKENADSAESDEMQRKEPVAFCVKCGAKNRADSAFCYSCGNKLS